MRTGSDVTFRTHVRMRTETDVRIRTLIVTFVTTLHSNFLALPKVSEKNFCGNVLSPAFPTNPESLSF